ncbi:hypothetical protein [Roseomonas elaeocarpi]|uniref:Uncharacterized protein n=1 Tax=Roseomonas elaeocarpi TaxID=907779 RepID=A0ABV6JMQ0_9PROT
MLPLDPPLSPVAVRGERNPLSGLDPVQRAALRSDRRDPEVRGRFARHLLETNPDSILGRMILAELAPTPAETEALLRDAVRIGQRLWGPELTDEVPVRWFDDPETRVFMAAVSAYGRTLNRRGLEREARECADFLLALDPADRLNVEESVMERPPKMPRGGPS